MQYIYVFWKKPFQNENWSTECSNVSDIYTDITSICEELQKAVQDYDHNAISINFIKKIDEISKEQFDTLDCSFIYTQMQNEILLILDFNEKHFKLRKIDKIEKEYDSQQVIQWYTYQSCLFSMVNRALRMMDVELIVNMIFLCAIYIIILPHFSPYNMVNKFIQTCLASIVA